MGRRVEGIAAVLVAVGSMGVAHAQAIVPSHATYAGGNEFDRLQDVYVAPDGKVYACGNTHSLNLSPWANQSLPGYQQTFGQGVEDGYVIVTTADMSTVLAWTYIGGPAGGPADGADRAYAVRTDDQSNIYEYGWTQSPAWAGGQWIGPKRDLFVIKYSSDLDQIHWTKILG